MLWNMYMSIRLYKHIIRLHTLLSINNMFISSKVWDKQLRVQKLLYISNCLCATKNKKNIDIISDEGLLSDFGLNRKYSFLKQNICTSLRCKLMVTKQRHGWTMHFYEETISSILNTLEKLSRFCSTLYNPEEFGKGL